MHQKGFIKILIIAIAVIIIGTIGYFTLVKKPPTTPPEGQGAYIPSEEEIIQVLFPKGGEKLEIGKTYEIRWENYIGDEPLTIGLQVTTPDGKIYLKRIAENIPVAASGSYRWTVTSEPADSKYKIEVYPEGNRPLVGRSKDFFSITGDSLIMVTTPKPLEEVASPLKVAGKGRRIFSEGEFIVRLVGFYLPDKPVLAETIAQALDCDWLAGDWCDFEVQLSFPSEKIKDALAMIELYQRDEMFGEKLIYKFPVAGEKTPAGKIEGQIIVKQSGGAGLLIAECANESYLTETADYVIEGTVEKVESKWNEERTSIFTYTDLRIEKYVKGTPFDSDKLQIQTPGGCTKEICLWVEDQPSFHESKKIRIYLKETNGEFSIVCGQFGVTEAEVGIEEIPCPIGCICTEDTITCPID